MAPGAAERATAPLIVGIGGTTRPGSSTELIVAGALHAARRRGAETILFGAAELDLPLYSPDVSERPPRARAFVNAVRESDGIMIGSPGYHGGISGLIKNALDYIEDLRDDSRPYLDGRAVGCIVCAYGWQATATTLVGLRSVVHALRGWPTPLGVCINSRELALSPRGEIPDDGVGAQLHVVADQVMSFASLIPRAFGAAPELTT